VLHSEPSLKETQYFLLINWVDFLELPPFGIAADNIYSRLDAEDGL